MRKNFEEKCLELGIEYLLKEWHRDNPVKPSQVLPGTETAYKWIKEVWRNGKMYVLEWEQSPKDRVRGRGCPYLNGSTVLKGFNDIPSTHSEIAKEWHPAKNIRNLHETSYGCNDRSIWWLCTTCGNEWQASPNNRTNGKTGCPKCNAGASTSFCEQSIVFYAKKHYGIKNVENRNTIFGFEIDITIRVSNDKPIILIEYQGEWAHSTYVKKRNDEEKKIKCSSLENVILYRIIEKSDIENDIVIDGHDIYCKPNKRNQHLNRVLPILFNIINQDLGIYLNWIFDIDINRDEFLIREQWRQAKYESSFGFIYPELVKEYDYERNGKLTPYMFYPFSSVKVFWKHIKLNINNEPTMHSWMTSFSKRAGGEGCPICQGKKPLSNFNTLDFLYKDLLKLWDYDKNDILPNQIVYGTNMMACWKHVLIIDGKVFLHQWNATVHHMVSEYNANRLGCPYCAGKMAQEGFNTIPDYLLSEWDFETNKENGIYPTQITYGYDKKVSWMHKIIRNGIIYIHRWDASPNSRTNMGSGCPMCKNKKVLTGYNDLKSHCPEIAEKWDYQKNGSDIPENYTIGSKHKVWWLDRDVPISICDRTKYLR